MNNNNIVWLASYPKSGNTWLRCFLDAYFLGDLDINELVTSFGDDVAGLYQIGDGSDITKLTVEEMYLARPMALLRLSRAYKDNGIPLFVKTHVPHLIANGIELLPLSLTKAVIHIVRDPRDVLPSYAKHMGKDIDIAIEWMSDVNRHLANTQSRVGEFLSSWDKHTNSYINADTHNVKTWLYEEMLADPVRVFSEMLTHAGIEPDMQKVKNAVEVVNIDNLKTIEKERGFVESSPYAKNQFFGQGKAGKWKKTLTPGQQYKMEKLFGRTMKRLGYEMNMKVA